MLTRPCDDARPACAVNSVVRLSLHFFCRWGLGFSPVHRQDLVAFIREQRQACSEPSRTGPDSALDCQEADKRRRLVSDNFKNQPEEDEVCER